MAQADSAKNIWDIISKLIPVATFMFGALLVLWREWVKNKRNLENIRDIIYKEMKHNYLLIVGRLPREKNLPEGQGSVQVSHVAILAGGVSDLPSSVYEKYLGRLAELPREEMDKIYNAYTHIKECGDMGRLTTRLMNEGVPIEECARMLIKECETALEVISKALLLFDDGEEMLDALKKKRGGKLDELDEYVERDKKREE